MAVDIALINDYYVTEALLDRQRRKGIRAPNAQGKDKLAEDAAYRFMYVCDVLTPSLLYYLYFACMGEARYSYNREEYDGFRRSTKELRETYGSREKTMTLALSLDPKKGFQTLLDVFSSTGYTAFGGRSWKRCAALGLDYLKGKYSKPVFINLAINSVHNNGWAFSKVVPARMAGLKINYGINLEHLGALSRYDPLTDIDMRVGMKTKKLVERYNILYNEKIGTQIIGTNLREEPIQYKFGELKMRIVQK